MNEKYMICDDGIRNERADGETVGYSFLVRIPYYRGIPLSLVEIPEVRVDDAVVPPEQIRFTTSCCYAFTLDEMTTVTAYRWEYGEKAKVTVLQDGGLTEGRHHVEIKIATRISYQIPGSYSYAWADLDVVS